MQELLPDWRQPDLAELQSRESETKKDGPPVPGAPSRLLAVRARPQAFSSSLSAKLLVLIPPSEPEMPL